MKELPIKEQLNNCTKEFEKCLMFLAEHHPTVYAEYKSHLKPIIKTKDGEKCLV